MPLGSGLANPLERIKQAHVYGSPSFFFTNTAEIAASGNLFLDFAERNTATRKYLPFDSIDIGNTDTDADIEVRLNDRTDLRELVLVKSEKILEDLPIGLHSIRIVNLDGANAVGANALKITVRSSEFNSDKLARAQEARKFGLGRLPIQLPFLRLRRF